MKIGELRKILSKYDDEVDIDYSDGNFGGLGDELTEHDIYEDDRCPGRLLIRSPYWTAVD